MIRLPGTEGLPPADRRALTLLTDLARLLPVSDAAADIVTLDLTDRPAAFPSLRAWQAAHWGIEAGDGVVRLARAALAVVTDLVTAERERRSAARDRFGRVPSPANALVAEGFEREPLVSQAAAALRDAVRAAAGRRSVRLVAPWPAGRRWAVALTHDLDVVAWWPVFTGLRLLELGRKGQLARAARVLGAAAAAVGRRPVGRALARLLQLERDRAVHSTWFVLCGTPTWRTFIAGDLTYRPESATVQKLLRDLREAAHAVGLHGSRATVTDATVFLEQRTRLMRLCEREVTGVRQHFLRFDPDATPAAMRAAGFRYDSTAGFADRNGFRLGVCDVVTASPSHSGEGDALAEVPFAWMDRALSKYRGVEDPLAWITDALELASTCRRVEGLWVGVWHPNLVPALGFPGAEQAYARLLDGLLAERPYVGTLDELVTWRAARARRRVTRLAPDGRLELAGPDSIPLEPSPP
jgi:hypothetical protein